MSEAQASAASAAKPSVSGEIVKPGQPGAKAPASGVPDFASTKHKVVYNGQEIEVDYDELRRGYGHNKAANQRFQEAKSLADQAMQVLDSFEDPKKGLDFLVGKLGQKKAREIFEDWLVDQMEYESLPESEKKARELEKRTKTLEEELAQERQEKEQRRRQEIESKAHADIDIEVTEALKKFGRKPTPRMVIAVVDEMLLQGQIQKRRVSAEEVLPVFQRNQEATAIEWLTGMSPSDAIKKLPKSFLDALRQHEVNQVLGEKQSRRTKVASVQNSSAEPKKLSTDEWFQQKQKQLSKKMR